MKNDSKNYSDLIPAYLSNRMTADERRSFESELVRNQALRDEVRDLVPIYQSVVVADRLTTGHIGVEPLTLYAEESSELDDNTLDEIKTHLDVCPECREKVELCREAIRTTEHFQPVEPATADSRGQWLKTIINFLYPTRFELRPAFVYSAVVVIGILVIIGVGLRDEDRASVQAFTIKGVAERGVDGSEVIQTIAVAPSSELVELSVYLDVKKDGHYSWALLTPDQQSSPYVPYVRIELPLVSSIPVNYLSEGPNTLRVIEVFWADDVYKPDTFNIRFDVRFSD